jgi:hypothetical protein
MRFAEGLSEIVMVIAFQSFHVHKRGAPRSSHPRRGLFTMGQAMLLIRSSLGLRVIYRRRISASRQVRSARRTREHVLSDLNGAD